MFLASSRPSRPGAYGAEAGVASCARSVTHLRDALPHVLVGSLAPAADAAKYAADLGGETLMAVTIKPGESYGFFTDTSICIGCKACEVACKEWNQLQGN